MSDIALIVVKGDANAAANKDVVPELFVCVVIYSDSAITTRNRGREKLCRKTRLMMHVSSAESRNYWIESKHAIVA